jgi:hypothetical protein
MADVQGVPMGFAREGRDLQLGLPARLMENLFLVLLGLLWCIWNVPRHETGHDRAERREWNW